MRVCRTWLGLLTAILLFGFAATAEAPAVPEDLLACVVLDAPPDFTGCEDAPGIACSETDALGRAGAAFAVLEKSMLTDAPRANMSGIALPGMHNGYYEFIEDGWVYNRCHLVGHRFGGASSPENLITGTHALNYAYMLPWEDALADWLWRTGKRAYYRVTPLYEGDELVCRGVRMEALACDGSWGFAVICPNAQPGVAVDYLTGWTTRADDWQSGGTEAAPRQYVINARTGRFHLPDCEDAKAIGRRNRKERTCGRGELLAEGCQPCGKCRP